MSRPLRIEFPDAWYHVMNRGRRGEAVYHDNGDYQAFIELLIESTEMWNLRVSAYCLMPNHYHLLVQTPDANISRCMRHINGVYTQRFNGRHRTDGQLFRGRYKSILVSGDDYLLQLVRYIHRNPVKAGLAGKPENYPWSSHNAYLSASKQWDWLNKPFICSFFSKNKKHWISMYRSFMASGDDEEVDAIIDGKKWPAVIGTRSFEKIQFGGQHHGTGSAFEENRRRTQSANRFVDRSHQKKPKADLTPLHRYKNVYVNITTDAIGFI